MVTHHVLLRGMATVLCIGVSMFALLVYFTIFVLPGSASWSREKQVDGLKSLLYHVPTLQDNRMCSLGIWTQEKAEWEQQHQSAVLSELPSSEALSCFDFARCNKDNFTVSVYGEEVNPYYMLIDGTHCCDTSSYFRRIIDAVKQSPFYVADPRKACVLVPGFDHTLINGAQDYPYRIAKELRRLPFWDGGKNHLLFNVHDWPYPQYDVGYAMVAKVGWSWPYYRPSFDLSLPPPTHEWKTTRRSFKSPTTPSWAARFGARKETGLTSGRDTLLLVFKGGYSHSIRYAMHALHNGKDIIAVHGKDRRYDFETLMKSSTFAFVPRGKGSFSYRFTEAISHGTIPVVVATTYVLPFEDIIDWRSAIVIVNESDVLRIPQLLRAYTPRQIEFMRCNLYHVWSTYLWSPHVHVSMAIEVLRERVMGLDVGRHGRDPPAAFGEDGTNCYEILYGAE